MQQLVRLRELKIHRSPFYQVSKAIPVAIVSPAKTAEGPCAPPKSGVNGEWKQITASSGIENAHDERWMY